jgi:hypothetical protein
MTDDEVEKFRASERERMAPMREAMRKEAFVQGYLRGSLSTKAVDYLGWLDIHGSELSSANDAEYAGGDVTLKALAEEYKVTFSTIHKVVEHHTWKHV